MGKRKACGRSMNLADAAKKSYTDLIKLLFDAQSDLELAIIRRLMQLYKGNDDGIKLAEEIANLESVLYLLIKTRLQLQAAHRIGQDTYRAVAELMQEPLRKIDTALKHL